MMPWVKIFRNKTSRNYKLFMIVAAFLLMFYLVTNIHLLLELLLLRQKPEKTEAMKGQTAVAYTLKNSSVFNKHLGLIPVESQDRKVTYVIGKLKINKNDSSVRTSETRANNSVKHLQTHRIVDNSTKVIVRKKKTQQNQDGNARLKTQDVDKAGTSTAYITVFPPRGQLCNQIFQVATLLGIARSKDLIPFISYRGFILDHVFDLPLKFHKVMDTSNFNVYREGDTFKYRTLDNVNSTRNWTLDGYFQVYKYFQNISGEVRSYFKFKKIFTDNAKSFFDKNVPKGNVKIGIHIRRKDFINPKERNLGRTTPGPGYVYRAMNYFRRQFHNVTFILVSDDISWCVHHIRAIDLVYGYFKQTGTDLAILSLCEHTIMSVGTFGWWGAWLAGGQVVYYDNYPRPGSQLDMIMVKKDYYPPHWIGMM